ncbi:hypothetical protein IMSHALPRED_010384 [Imshaugia aleurites]|uniref:Uncharacterized protein n=1 Tax=Imshaugia aleurites TaxID=172621 RepID=A0A8H3G494_9LECA|nr:hypothetical protein IMSHALPRED_010384 [Imshaugia aleurites]
MICSLSVGPLLASALAWIGAVEAVSLPGCQNVAPPEKNLTSVRTAEITVPAHPFGVVYAQQNDLAFVALNTSLGVLNTSAFIPSLTHEIPLPAPYVSIDGASGITLTHDGRHVLVTAFSAALIVVDVAKAATGSPEAVVGILNGTAAAGHSAIEVTVTRDDKYAFVSQEDGSLQTGERGTIEVFKLQRPAANGTVSGTYIGYLVLGDLVVGTALSSDGRLLYATSETASENTTTGTLSVIDVAKLKTTPSEALISQVAAGCGPVRVLVSRDDQVVWVTARESNALLAFDASKLISNQSAAALLASVQVGTSPVGLRFAGANERRILTANSNRFASLDPALYGNATTGLSVVDVDAAIRGEQANLGQIPTGLFPRELALSPDGKTILVSDYGSFMIQAIDVSTLP